MVRLSATSSLSSSLTSSTASSAVTSCDTSVRNSSSFSPCPSSSSSLPLPLPPPPPTPVPLSASAPDGSAVFPHLWRYFMCHAPLRDWLMRASPYASASFSPAHIRRGIGFCCNFEVPSIWADMTASFDLGEMFIPDHSYKNFMCGSVVAATSLHKHLVCALGNAAGRNSRQMTSYQTSVRRMVVDMGSMASINIIEFSWMCDGALIVTTKMISPPTSPTSATACTGAFAVFTDVTPGGHLPSAPRSLVSFMEAPRCPICIRTGCLGCYCRTRPGTDNNKHNNMMGDENPNSYYENQKYPYQHPHHAIKQSSPSLWETSSRACQTYDYVRSRLHSIQHMAHVKITAHVVHAHAEAQLINAYDDPTLPTNGLDVQAHRRMTYSLGDSRFVVKAVLFRPANAIELDTLRQVADKLRLLRCATLHYTATVDASIIRQRQIQHQMQQQQAQLQAQKQQQQQQQETQSQPQSQPQAEGEQNLITQRCVERAVQKQEQQPEQEQEGQQNVIVMKDNRKGMYLIGNDMNTCDERTQAYYNDDSMCVSNQTRADIVTTTDDDDECSTPDSSLISFDMDGDGLDDGAQSTLCSSPPPGALTSASLSLALMGQYEQQQDAHGQHQDHVSAISSESTGSMGTTHGGMSTASGAGTSVCVGCVVQYVNGGGSTCASCLAKANGVRTMMNHNNVHEQNQGNHDVIVNAAHHHLQGSSKTGGVMRGGGNGVQGRRFMSMDGLLASGMGGGHGKCATRGRKKKYARSGMLHQQCSEDGRERLKCAKCDKTFSQQGSLNRHLKNIHDQRKIPCDYCMMTFGQMFDLKRHQRRKHADKQSTTVRRERVETRVVGVDL